jgi:Transmembrane amino acid transporter protein
MTLVTSLAAFGAVSTIATVGCYVQALAVGFELVHQTDGVNIWTFPPVSTLFKVNVPGLIYISPMVCFVFAYHYLLTETLSELEDPTYERMTMVNASTTGVLFGCYFPLAVAGYLNYSGKDIPANMLTDLNESSAAVLIARLVIAGLLFFTYSLFIIPLRRRLEAVLFGSLSTSMTEAQRVKVAGALALTVCAASIALPDLSLANTVAGGCIALVMFFFPGAMILHGQHGPYSGGAADRARVAVGFAFVAAGAIVAAVGLFGQAVFDY